MKKPLFLFGLATIGSLFQSCSDILTSEGVEESVILTKSVTDGEELFVSTVTRNGENLIRFKDLQAYSDVIQMMNSQTNEERIKFTDSLNVKTITSFLSEADKELDQICESATNADFSEKYKLYKKTYANILMFNDSDLEDLSAYSKLKNPMEDNIANKRGEFMIGDSLVCSKEFRDFSEFNSSNITTYSTYSTSSYNNDVNHAWSHTNKRKVGLYLSLDEPLLEHMGITMRLTAQKKTVFGWKRYSTEYYGRFKLKGPGAGFEFCESTYFGFPYEKYINKNNQEFQIHTRELDGNFSVLFGRVGRQSTPHLHQYVCSGQMEIWSRGIDKENRGIARVDLNE